MFGSVGTVITETWEIFHATAPGIHGPWTEREPIRLGLEGSGVAAPGVVHENGVFHMFIQTDFMRAGGTIEHLTSEDGFVWRHEQTVLHAITGTNEHGIYDPHPAEIAGERYLVYSGMPPFERMPQPDVYLVKSMSGTWHGPWLRMGKILDHECIESHHNARGHQDYEWGIEGPQLAELPDGKILLNATCFLPGGERGQRQRVFFAVADKVTGPYRTLGPVLTPTEAGENGHATVVLEDGEVLLCYQSRLSSTNHEWRYGIAAFDARAISAAGAADARFERI